MEAMHLLGEEGVHFVRRAAAALKQSGRALPSETDTKEAGKGLMLGAILAAAAVADMAKQQQVLTAAAVLASCSCFQAGTNSCGKADQMLVGGS
jgi:hypothetical protein